MLFQRLFLQNTALSVEVFNLKQVVILNGRFPSELIYVVYLASGLPVFILNIKTRIYSGALISTENTIFLKFSLKKSLGKQVNGRE